MATCPYQLLGVVSARICLQALTQWLGSRREHVLLYGIKKLPWVVLVLIIALHFVDAVYGIFIHLACLCQDCGISVGVGP